MRVGRGFCAEELYFIMAHNKLTQSIPSHLSLSLFLCSIVQKLLQNTIVREIKPIQNVVAIHHNKKGEQYYYLHTEGVNYKAIASLDFIDANRINSNDIAAIYRTYGVRLRWLHGRCFYVVFSKALAT